MKNLNFVAIFVLSFFLSAQAFAEIGVSSNTNAQVGVEVRTTELDKKREALKAQMDAKREEIKMETEARREALNQKIETQRDSLMNKRTEFNAEVKASIELRRAQFKAEIEAVKKERVADRKAFVEKRLQMALVILEKQQVKLAELLNERTGEAAVDAQAKLEVSQKSLVEARASVDAFVALQAAESNVEALRAAAKKSEELIKRTKDELIEAVRAMRGPGVEVNAEVSATAE